MNNLLLLCLQIMLFALISPISGQYETEVNQNNGDDYQNNGADYQNNGYIGDGDNDYENNGDYNKNNGEDYQNNGADYQNNNNQNNGLDDQNEASNPLDSEELQHLKDMRQEMAGLNRRLKPPSLQNTHSEFKPQSLDLGGDNGEQTFITLGPGKSTTTDTTTTTTEIETTPTTVTDLPTTPTTVTDLPTTPTTVTDLPTTPTITTGIVSEPPTPPPGGNETCRDWLPWGECQQSADGSKCEKERTCVGGPPGSNNETQDCPNVEPPMCGNTPPTGNCTKYDYKDCGPTCLRCGCCIDPPGFVGVGEYGCEPCTGGICEPLV